MHGTTTRAIYTIRFSITLVKLFSFFVHPMTEFVDIYLSEMDIIFTYDISKNESSNQYRCTQVLNRFVVHDDISNDNFICMNQKIIYEQSQSNSDLRKQNIYFCAECALNVVVTLLA